MKNELIDILFPAPCLLCGKPPRPLCKDCEPLFSVSQDEEGSFYASDLNDSMATLVKALKDKNRTALLPMFAAGLRPCLEEAISQSDPTLLVCPPSSKRNFRKRGLNPAFEIIRRAAPAGIKVSKTTLVHTRQPIDQRELDSRQRAKNAENLYRAKPSNERVLLVDDVKTTGATLQSATAALISAGAEVVGSCVLAKRIQFS